MKSFNEVYEEIYKQSNEELETLRKKRIKEFSLIIIIPIAISLVLAIILLKNTKIGMEFIRTCIMLTIFSIISIEILITIILIFGSSKATDLFKEKAINPFIKNIDEGLNYYPQKGILQSIYAQGEFERYDNYYTEDLISGVLDRKYAVKMAEVHTEDESTDSDGNTTTTTLFHGIFGYVECAKSIQTSLKVHSDHGFLGKLFKGKTKIEMDSADFEKYFDVYGENKIIAMQILTADVMAMMIDFRQESKIRYEMTIKNNQMFIRFHTGPVFEPKLLKKSLDYDMLKKYYDIIDFIFRVSRGINKAIEETEI